MKLLFITVLILAKHLGYDKADASIFKMIELKKNI